MNITKAVVHTLDNDCNTIILSEQALNLNNNTSVEIYLEKLVKGILNSVSVSSTHLGINTYFQDYVGQTFPFLESSKRIAQDWFANVKARGEAKPSNLVIVQADKDDVSFLCVFEVHNKDGYIKFTQNQANTENTILYNQGILPSSFASVKGAFLLNLNDGSLKVRYRSNNREFLETLLDCKMIANAKESFQVVDSLVHHFSDKRNEDRLTNAIKARSVITDNLELFDAIEPAQILKEVFPVMDDNEVSIMDQSFTANHVGDYINLKEVNRSSMIRKHRIITESGIEIILPLDIVDVTHIVDIQENENGNATITLRGVGKILQD